MFGSREKLVSEQDMGYGYRLLNYARRGPSGEPGGYLRLIRADDRTSVAVFEPPLLGKVREMPRELLEASVTEIGLAMSADLQARGISWEEAGERWGTARDPKP